MKFAPSKASLQLALMLAAIPLAPAFAHTGTGVAGGLTSGFLHPLTGPDHLVAMIAVGLWGAQLGKPAIWVLPITFPLVMAIGGLIGLSGMELPLVEFIIAFSGLALGAMVALNVRPPLAISSALVALFAIFHGYAHGRELPEAADATAYAVGFVVATGMLHLVGILIGALITRPAGAGIVRACGAAIGCVGLYFMLAAAGVVG
ncbi:HupE/UreJ family protein [Terrihabitans rhizophilus]|jgi:urease accessory protein|uniref:HupE/UreJ family protein n=1 Tax=Terrihabitans rhizophilus TaxID=3092662 RepID=A0ABU4RP93_9HYPH|nr:HupE/UreJ family protein [Terrihabitans sp. PJ23]MDX6805914.1 HupE/UreJ family protein [Terrihabitans sp. PJ23]